MKQYTTSPNVSTSQYSRRGRLFTSTMLKLWWKEPPWSDPGRKLRDLVKITSGDPHNMAKTAKERYEFLKQLTKIVTVAWHGHAITGLASTRLATRYPGEMPHPIKHRRSLASHILQFLTPTQLLDQLKSYKLNIQ